VWQSPDPILGDILSSPQRLPELSRKLAVYSYVLHNPLSFTDPDGRDAIAIAFPDYKIRAHPDIAINHTFKTRFGDIPFKFTHEGKYGNLGHAGIVLIDNKTGYTRYFEYGRYDKEKLGIVRTMRVPNVKIGKDGLPTKDSLTKLMATISRQSGQGGKVEGAYVQNGNYSSMLDYSQGRIKSNTDPERESYGLWSNQCMTFSKDMLESGGVETPSMIDPRPNGYIGKLQNSFSPVNYDPKSGKLSGALYNNPVQKNE
jgi:hypothetical protein